MTPYYHAVSSVKKFGGSYSDYIRIHEWFDETKQFTGNWTHRALRHHAAGVQWCCEEFGTVIQNTVGKLVPVKLIAEQHVTEDCGFIPTVADWLSCIGDNPKPWMTRVEVKSHELPLTIQEDLK